MPKVEIAIEATKNEADELAEIAEKVGGQVRPLGPADATMPQNRSSSARMEFNRQALTAIFEAITAAITYVNAAIVIVGADKTAHQKLRVKIDGKEVKPKPGETIDKALDRWPK